jgi:deazaflavin-dependent oxidoreductase (nitroreductase family)
VLKSGAAKRSRGRSYVPLLRSAGVRFGTANFLVLGGEVALSHGDAASAATDDASRVDLVAARSRLARAATAAIVLAGLNWAVWYLLPHDDSIPIAAWAWTVFLAVNVGLMVSPTLKQHFVGFIQRWLLNPPVRALLAVGVLPLGWALIETTGRRTGKPRRTPVGNGLVGQTFWIVAEHGYDAGYVRNLQHHARVRVKARRGLRAVWISGTATVMTGDDPYDRQRTLARWHPLRALNAAIVRVMGTTLLTIRIDLDT